MLDNSSPTYSDGYKRYVLFVLTGVYSFNFIDRQILVILSEPIKNDLGLSDTQLGLLTGLAFAIFYVGLGLPIARYADRNNRKKVVSISLVIWSAMTAVSGLAQNFIQLLLARIGVGVGEAGGSPPSHSIISDYYEPEKRATALSIYSTGVYIGIFLGFLTGGIIAELYNWRVALYSLGIPGILYAILVWFTVKEPEKGRLDKTEDANKEFDFKTVVKVLLGKKSFVLLALATGFQAFGQYGVSNFFPSFLQRIYGMGIKETGIILAIIAVVGGGTGTFLGGYLTDKFRNRNIKWYFWIPAIAIILNVIPSFFIFFGGDKNITLGLGVVTYLLSAVYLGPSIAITHSLVPAKMRAFSSAVLFFVLNLIGMGLGPTVVGLLSDYWEPTMGIDSLRYAFLSTIVTGIIAAVLFYLAAQSYKSDLEKTIT